MPYITAIRRKDFTYILSRIFNDCASGELNYLITKILLLQEPKTYEDFNRLIGVLEGVKFELYRRAIVPYENKKIEENGDVY